MGKKLSRRHFIAGAGAAGATALAGKKVVNSLSDEQLAYLPRIIRPHDTDSLNVITIMCDTVRYDHIGFFGNTEVQTPNIDALASESVVFDKAYTAGFPTVLNRAEFVTGKYMYARMGWEDLPDDEVVLAQLLNDAGFTTGIVFDTLHFKNDQFTLNRGFQSWEWVRGQEEDRWRPVPLDPPLPADPSKLRFGAAHVSQYLRNMAERQGEADYLVARTMQAAIAWLRRVHSHNNFYLHIDSFDPHEPWDPPQSYVDLYNPGYTGEEVIYPAYAPPDYLSAAELEHVRALYKAELTMVDFWLGQLLTEISDLGLAANTVIFFLSDHGFLHGEHNAVGKTWDHEGHYEAYPLWEELVRVPLMVRIPGQSPRRTNVLAQPADIMPTVLDILGVGVPGAVEAKSLLPAIQNDTPVHDVVISSLSLKSAPANPIITVNDGRWALHYGGTHAASALYDLDVDPQQHTNVLGANCAVAQALHGKLVNFLQGLDLPDDYLAPWLPAPC